MKLWSEAPVDCPACWKHGEWAEAVYEDGPTVKVQGETVKVSPVLHATCKGCGYQETFKAMNGQEEPAPATEGLPVGVRLRLGLGILEMYQKDMMGLTPEEIALEKELSSLQARKEKETMISPDREWVLEWAREALR